MILLLLLALTAINFYFGAFVLLQILIWSIVFFLSNFLLGFNPLNKKLQMIRIISIVIIIFILYSNTQVIQFPAATALIIPFSITNISYLDELDYDEKTIKIEEISIIEILHINEEFTFLNSLDDDSNYIVNIEFIPDLINFQLDAPLMLLSKPFLANKFSSQTTVNKFIGERLDYMVDYYYLDDSILQSKNNFSPRIKLTFSKFIAKLN